MKPLKDLLKTIYGDDKTVSALKDDHLIEVSENLKAGVPVATPVFDGAHEGDVTASARSRWARFVRTGDAL